jgi:hypothetical protein
MATFDNIINDTPAYIVNFTGYTGNPPTTEAEYNTLDCWKNKSIAPTWVDIQAKFAQIPVLECKAQAKSLLAASDWSVLPDVQISNKADFENYRAILRGYVISPVTNPTLPTEPTPIWN